MPDHLTTRTPAIVLAGGKTSPEFAAEAGNSQRALADIHGWTMVRYVIAALNGATGVDRVILVAPTGFAAQPGVAEQLAAEGTLSENIQAGLDRCDGAEYALLVTADIPFLTPEAVDDYLRRCRAADADCCYAAITREACEKRFAGMKRTYVRISGQTVTGGNAVYQRVAAFPQMAESIREAYLRRKNPLYLARLIGLENVAKLVTGRLQTADIERGASRLMGVSCRLINTPYPEVGTDVDKPADLRLARELLRPPG
jgi:molybdopterin-guanine dinucleotide biosynthesis protein A